jgi:hypothetical protein
MGLFDEKKTRGTKFEYDTATVMVTFLLNTIKPIKTGVFIKKVVFLTLLKPRVAERVIDHYCFVCINKLFCL